ncbi:MAG: hypothetical protein CM15mP109_09030 [Candidatus Dadabacteria bacterium]|nr:MAG: hypothetical protein CM15mP109_09030 [Candidatus Dadabacteria bacterium]
MQQEFRLTSEYDGPFNFTAGVSYAEDNLEFCCICCGWSSMVLRCSWIYSY